MNIHRPLSAIMTTDLKVVQPLSLMTEVANIFETNTIHHIPVVTEENIAIGIISRHDYCQLQHHFTRKGWEMAEAANKRLFESLTVKEVMTENPVQMGKDTPVSEALDYFLVNRIHSIVVTDAGFCVGIITPYDVLKEMRKLSLVLQ